jgi:DNA-binding PadR family transcriptional regulator
MSTKADRDRIELLQGTLDLLILRTLRLGPAHGHAIAKAIGHGSDDVLQVEQGSLYPALHRLIKRGQRIHQATDDSLRIEEGSLYPALQRMTHEKWLRAEWGVTDTGRKARFYTITPTGRRQLAEEERRWLQLTEAVAKALRFA